MQWELLLYAISFLGGGIPAVFSLWKTRKIQSGAINRDELIVNLTAKVDRLEHDKDNAINEQKKLAQDIAKLTEDLASKGAELERVKKDHDKQLEDWKNQAKVETDKLKDDVVALNRKLTELTNQKKELESKTADLERKLTAAQSAAQSANDKRLGMIEAWAALGASIKLETPINIPVPLNDSPEASKEEA